MFIFGAGRCVLETTRRRNLSAAQKKCCEADSNTLFALLPNFARACGRVSVGRYPDKRPDSRQGMKNRGSFSLSGQHLSQEMPLKVSSSVATVTGSRRRTGAPRSQRGTRLKATTDRAFLVSTGIPPPARATEKACPSLPGVRAGYSQPIHGSTVGLSFKASSRLHRAARRGTRIRHHFG